MDVINKTIGGKVLYKRKNTDTTYRNIIFPYFDGHFYEQWGTSILFGTKVDEKATTLFLPVELEQSLASTTYNGKPIVSETKKLMTFPKQKAPFSLWNNIYTYLIVVAAIVLVNKKGLTVFYLMVVGLFGIFCSISGFYSMHEELAYNYNVLLFNPVLLLLGIFYLRNAVKAMKIISIISLLCIAIYIIIVATKPHFLVVLPIIIANSIILMRLFAKSRKPA